MLLLQRIELGQGIASDEAVRIARIDPADEGVDGVVEEALTETSSATDSSGSVPFLRKGSPRMRSLSRRVKSGVLSPERGEEGRGRKV